MCDPIIYNRDLPVSVSITGVALDPNGPANPCGLIAYTVFNDTYVLSNTSIANIPITDQGIDWPSDNKYFNPKLPDQMWLNTSNPRVRVWMRVSALPDFRKIWGKIDGNLAAGNYNVFECVLCHEHSQGETNPEHRSVGGYVYESRACYQCHLRGRE